MILLLMCRIKNEQNKLVQDQTNKFKRRCWSGAADRNSFPPPPRSFFSAIQKGILPAFFHSLLLFSLLIQPQAVESNKEIIHKQILNVYSFSKKLLKLTKSHPHFTKGINRIHHFHKGLFKDRIGKKNCLGSHLNFAKDSKIPEQPKTFLFLEDLFRRKGLHRKMTFLEKTDTKASHLSFK